MKSLCTYNDVSDHYIIAKRKQRNKCCSGRKKWNEKTEHLMSVY